MVISTSLAAFSQSDDSGLLDEDSLRSLLAHNNRVLESDLEVGIAIYYDSSNEEIDLKKQVLGMLGIEMDFEYTRNALGEIESMRTLTTDGEGLSVGFGKLIVMKHQDGHVTCVMKGRPETP